MELPISVMVVFFVALVVGVAVLGFASTNLHRASDDIRNLPGLDDEDLMDKMVDVGDVTEDRVRLLGEQCLRDFHGRLDDELCYIVRGDVADNIQLLDGEEIDAEGSWEFNVDIDGSPSALFIWYRPLQGRIEVNS